MAAIKDKNEVVRKAVQQLKDSKFAVTGIKVELEANLHRSNRGDRDPVYGGGNLCFHCTQGRMAHDDCDICTTCDGDAEIYDDEECEYVSCVDCDGTGRRGCDECTDGQVECNYCHGVWQRPLAVERPVNYGRESDCFNFIMADLVEVGLAKKLTPEERIANREQLLYGVDQEYEVVHPLKYAKFYNDGSVDSELTYTVAIDNPDNVHHLVRVTEAWNKLVVEIGNGSDVTGAGMHMALLREENCVYPDNARRANDATRYHNYEKSMRMLIPALFFLGSVSNVSRALRYREPRVSGEKYSAVCFHYGVLEFRVFETCYDNPEAILDNVVVMANTIKYWSDTFVSTGIEKKIKTIRFGTDDDNTLHRFYQTPDHIDVLNMGLAKLKPAHYTIGQLKKQRQFDTNKRTAGNMTKNRRKQAEKEYSEYLERFNWKMELLKAQRMYYEMDGVHPTSPEQTEELMAAVQRRVDAHVEVERNRKQPLQQYIESVMAKYQSNTGRWTLEVN